MEGKAGIFVLKNNNGKVFIGSSKNVDKEYQKLRNQLNADLFKHKQLQADWNDCQGDQFTYEVLDRVPEKQLKQSERKWLQNYDPDELYNPIVKENQQYNLWVPKGGTEPVTKDASEVIGTYQNSLDYNLTYYDDRKAHLESIMNDEWNVDYTSCPGFIEKQIKKKNSFLTENETFGKGMEKVAHYIIHTKYQNEGHEHKVKNKLADNLDEKYTTLSKNAELKNEQREVLIDYTYHLEEREDITTQELQQMYKRLRESEKRLREQRQISESDIQKYPELQQMHEAKMAMAKMKNDLHKGNSDYYKLNKLHNDIGYEMFVIREQLRKPITFQKIIKTSPSYNWNIDLRNREHVRALIKNYPLLIDKYQYRVNGSLYTIFKELEELIEWAYELGYLDNVQMRILNLYMQKSKFEDIVYARNKNGEYLYEDDGVTKVPDTKVNPWTVVERINEGLEKKKSKRSIDDAIAKQIPEALVKAFTDRELIHSHDGEFQSCNVCEKEKPATDGFFSPDDRNNNGLRKICKNCR